MTKPTEEEINKKIAEFMGFEEVQVFSHYMTGFSEYIGRVITIDYLYTESLDTLVLVAETLNIPLMKISLNMRLNGDWICNFQDWQTEESSPSKALARAIYEAIK